MEVWRDAMALAKEVYVATAKFPSEERFGLVNQMRRAAVSIPSNIAEGHARSSTTEFQRFVLIAMGSVAELETQVRISLDLDYLGGELTEALLDQLDSVGKRLRALHKALAKRKECVQR